MRKKKLYLAKLTFEVSVRVEATSEKNALNKVWDLNYGIPYKIAKQEETYSVELKTLNPEVKKAAE